MRGPKRVGFWVVVVGATLVAGVGCGGERSEVGAADGSGGIDGPDATTDEDASWMGQPDGAFGPDAPHFDRDGTDPEEDGGASADARMDGGGDAAVDGDGPPTPDPDPDPGCVPATAPMGPLVLQTAAGAVEGGRVEGVRRWLGVPYAAPPVGALRWRSPAPARCRRAVLRADVASRACPQRSPDTGAFSGDEDCLQLNVWAPDVEEPEDGWPVLVFVHGGGNVIGSAGQTIGQTRQLLYDGGRLAARGLVVVTVNYRLGALGWLALPSLDEEQGEPATNFALQDQQAALRWIHEYLPAVGADVRRVLLVGESAGAVNTIAHVVAPGSAGLFHRAAVMSGAPTTRTLVEAQSQATAQVVASVCGGLDGADELACLRGRSPEEIDAIFPGEIFIGGTELRGTGSSYGPVVDGVHIPEAPDARVAGRRHNDVPTLVTTTSEEMAELLDTRSVRTAEDVERVVRAAFGPLVGAAGVDRIVDAYPVAAYPTPADALIAVYSDVRFVCTARRWLTGLQNAQSQPVYRGWFARRGVTPQRTLPASHGRELTYLFGALYRIPFFAPVADDEAVGEQMERAWAAFAYDGVPVASDDVEWVTWEPSRDPAFVFDAEPGMQEGLRAETCAMWESLLRP